MGRAAHVLLLARLVVFDKVEARPPWSDFVRVRRRGRANHEALPSVANVFSQFDPVCFLLRHSEVICLRFVRELF